MVNWLSTMILQVPCHEILTLSFDPVVHQKRVSTNWIRTAAWSLRGILVLWMASSTLKRETACGNLITNATCDGRSP